MSYNLSDGKWHTLTVGRRINSVPTEAKVWACHTDLVLRMTKPYDGIWRASGHTIMLAPAPAGYWHEGKLTKRAQQTVAKMMAEASDIGWRVETAREAFREAFNGYRSDLEAHQALMARVKQDGEQERALAKKRFKAGEIDPGNFQQILKETDQRLQKAADLRYSIDGVYCRKLERLLEWGKDGYAIEPETLEEYLGGPAA